MKVNGWTNMSLRSAVCELMQDVVPETDSKKPSDTHRSIVPEG
jgi:hypothetical protein